MSTYVFTGEGWIYHSEVCIWKDPVTAMQRTKALGLLHKQIRKDSAMSRQGIADYVVTMRKPGENPDPVAHTHESFPVERSELFDEVRRKDFDKDAARKELIQIAAVAIRGAAELCDGESRLQADVARKGAGS